MTTAQEERRRWDELKKLASEGNVQEFYRRYAAYLEWAGVHSESRAVLLKMAKAVADGSR